MDSPDCGQWRPIASDDSCADWGTGDDWILITGSWEDMNFYRDIAVWNDGVSNWDK